MLKKQFHELQTHRHFWLCFEPDIPNCVASGQIVSSLPVSSPRRAAFCGAWHVSASCGAPESDGGVRCARVFDRHPVEDVLDRWAQTRTASLCRTGSAWSRRHLELVRIMDAETVTSDS